MSTKTCTICEGKLVYGRQEKKCFRCNDTGRVPETWIEPANPDMEIIRKISLASGYNIIEHGSQVRDFDLVAIPWEPEAISCRDLVQAMCKQLNAKIIDRASKPHGRYAFSLQVDGYVKLIDLSVTPRLRDTPNFPHFFKPRGRYGD